MDLDYETMDYEWVICPRCGSKDCERYFNKEVMDIFCNTCGYEYQGKNTDKIPNFNYVLDFDDQLEK